MKYSKKTREEAAQAPSMLANDPRGGISMFIGSVLASDTRCYILAYAAFVKVFDHDINLPWSVTYAEAEALIRTGFTP